MIQHTPTPELNKYDFDGGCAPHSNPHGNYSTFTLGIFQWIAKAGYRGKHGMPLKPNQMKRGKVIHRVRGVGAQPEKAYEEARRLIAQYNTVGI